MAETEDIDVVAVEVDDDVSATGVRPGFERLLMGISEDRYDAVLACGFTRLCREPGDFERLLTTAEQHKVRLLFERGGFDLSTSLGMVQARIVAAVHAAEMRSRHARRAMSPTP
jgi:DNA invertase Pin-like site-specific DNA recombinase